MPKRPFSDDDGLYLDSEEEEEDDDDDDDDEDDDDEEQAKAKETIRRKVFAKHFPELKEMVKKTFGDNKTNLITDKEERSCAICPNIQWFKGWKALQAHAETFKKRKAHHHRGYADAIKEALQANVISCDGADAHIGTRTVSLNIEAAKNRLIVWPPILAIQCKDKNVSISNIARTFLLDFTKKFPNTQTPMFHCISSWEGLLEFEADYFGYLDAEFVKNNYRRFPYPIHHMSLMIPSKMKEIDPQRVLIDWKEESYHEKVIEPQRKAREEHDHEQAQLKEMQIKVENLTEDEERFNVKKSHFDRLIFSRQSEIEERKQRKEQIARDYENKMHSLEAIFQRDILIFEARSTARIKRLQQQLETSENEWEEVRKARMVEIENLQKQFQKLTNDRRQEEAQEALRKELQAIEKAKLFKETIEKRVAEFNQRAHEQESELQEKQHLESMQLLEEAKNEKQKLMQEVLLKQKNGKRSNEEAPTNQNLEQKVARVECAMCMDELTEENRAILHPCGHATICLECALSIFKDKRLCPMCRAFIKKTPVLLPKKIYM